MFGGLGSGFDIYEVMNQSYNLIRYLLFQDGKVLPE